VSIVVSYLLLDILLTVAISQHHRETGRLQIIKVLITQGIRIESKNTKGWSALITAAFCGEVDIIILLLNSGADIDARAEDGLTALIVASQVKRKFHVSCNLLRGLPHKLIDETEF
jgi:ankyrin repeat protein